MTEKTKIGEKSIDFSLQDQNRQIFRLANHIGKRVLLSFHPLAWTFICAKQMKTLEDNKRFFDSMNTIVVGISVDSVPSKKAWADSLGIVNTPLLSDFWPHGEIAQKYGILREKDGFCTYSYDGANNEPYMSVSLSYRAEDDMIVIALHRLWTNSTQEFVLRPQELSAITAKIYGFFY